MTRTRTPILAAALAGALALAVAPGAGAEEATSVTPATASAVQDSPAQEVTPAGEGSPAEKPFSKDDANPAADQPVAAGLVALPAVLTLDGTTYYLNADGATYVTDMGRINAAPTAQETENTKAMLAKNSAEVGRQAIAEAKAGGQKPAAAPVTTTAPAGDAPATTTAGAPASAPAATTAAVPAATGAPAPAERGMAAQTGSNTAARGLFALVMASVMGAAVYASARRTLI